MATFFDNLNRADGGMGTDYLAVAGGAIDSGGLAIIGNAAGTFSFVRKGNIVDPAVFDFADDQVGHVKINSAFANSVEALVFGRMSTTAVGYVVSTNGASGSGNTFIALSGAGGFTELKAVATTFASGDEIGISCIGNVIGLWKNRTLIDSVTDSSVASGQLGGAVYGGTVGTNFFIDDFDFADVGGAVRKTLMTLGVG